MLSNILHDADIKPFQQSHPTGETFLEIYLAAHSTLGNSSHLGSHAVALSQLIDALGLDERRIHIEADEAAHTPKHVVALEREVHLHFRRQPHQFRLHLLTVHRLAAQ